MNKNLRYIYTHIVLVTFF